MHARVVAVALVSALVGVSTGSTAPARAQDPPVAAVRLELLGQPLWHKPGDTLGIRLRMTNQTATELDGFRLQLEVYDRVGSRSALREAVDGNISGLFSSIPRDVGRKVPAFSSTTVEIDPPVEEFSTLATAVEGGVYPLRVSVFDLSAVPLGTVTIPLIYYPSAPETPLNLVLALPLHDLAARSADGVFRPGQSGEWALEEALSPQGWLNGMLTALEEAARPPAAARRRGGRGGPARQNDSRPIRLSLAPTPRLVEELADMAGGYRRADLEGEVVEIDRRDRRSQAAASFVERLSAVTARSDIQPLLTPYSFPDMPTVRGVLGETEINAQLEVGRTILGNQLGVSFRDRWLFPPAGRLDRATLEALTPVLGAQRAGVLLSEESLADELDPNAGCPDVSVSYACPFTVESIFGQTPAYSYDVELQHRFVELAHSVHGRLLLQQLFAETAMIREEAPGITGRVVHATIPSFWRPSPRMSRLLLNGLAHAPWIRTLTANEGLRAAGKIDERRIVDVAPSLGVEPDESYFASVSAAGEAVDAFTSMGPPEVLFQRLQRDVLVSQSRSWWGDQLRENTGLSFATDAAQEANSEMAKVTLGAVEQITLTSRRGKVQVSLFNDADYPVAATISLTSQKLSLDPSEIQRQFPPGTTPIVIEATAQSSGVSPLLVELLAPDGTSIGTAKRIEVRSTSFNEIALAITIGALLFLIFFYVLSAVRKRRRKGEAETGVAPA